MSEHEELKPLGDFEKHLDSIADSSKVIDALRAEIAELHATVATIQQMGGEPIRDIKTYTSTRVIFDDPLSRIAELEQQLDEAKAEIEQLNAQVVIRGQFESKCIELKKQLTKANETLEAYSISRLQATADYENRLGALSQLLDEAKKTHINLLNRKEA